GTNERFTRKGSANLPVRRSAPGARRECTRRRRDPNRMNVVTRLQCHKRKERNTHESITSSDGPRPGIGRPPAGDCLRADDRGTTRTRPGGGAATSALGVGGRDSACPADGGRIGHRPESNSHRPSRRFPPPPPARGALRRPEQPPRRPPPPPAQR